MAMAMATTPSTVTAATFPHSHTLFLRSAPTPTFPTKSKLSSFNACKNLTSNLTSSQSRTSSGHVKNPILFFTSTSSSSPSPIIVCLAAASGEGDNAEVVGEEDKGGDDTAKGVEELKLVSETDWLKKKAKKVMERRKRLLQKRKLRKKGRWPPSKMAKLKNI